MCCRSSNICRYWSSTTENFGSLVLCFLSIAGKPSHTGFHPLRPSSLLYALHFTFSSAQQAFFIALYLFFFLCLCSVQSIFMASTSTSTPDFDRYHPPTSKLAFPSDRSYHVFLSFRGPDVRDTLVNDLYQALSAAGLNVFIDSDKLEKGEMICESLERAIERSAIRIPIFSKGYADSVWCLKEAAAMLSTHAKIIRLFYDVDPTHVRYPLKESSPYNESFRRHYGHSDRYPREEVDGWKNALLEICKRSGWTMDLDQGAEARLIKIVVNDLINTLDRVPLDVTEHLVGMESVKNVLIQKLNQNAADEVLKLGIWGIGGIGKTTLAKAIYNQIHGDFEAYSFVFNVRASAADLTKLQEKILKDLVNYKRTVDSTDEGKSLFRESLGGRRVLQVLDDVDDVVQLKALVGDWLAPRSRVIITSRNKHILNVAGADCIHEMSELNRDEGLQLFCWHAFLRPSPTPTYQRLSEEIVEACKGHPLSLEVIGSFLYDKQDNRGCWEEALRNITSNRDIYDRLYISYSALTDDEKEIFLDIACFFVGEHKRFPINLWKSLYEKVDTALCNLSMKLLIKIDDGGVFGMHDHLRDMGRTIAGKEKEGTRIWKATHSSIIPNNSTHLPLDGGNPQRLKLMYRPSLPYLCLQNVAIGDALALLLPSIKWLKFHDGENATTVDILQLKAVKITSCMDESHSISSLFSLPNIQHLDLSGSLGFNNLPHTIGNLSQLQQLDLSRCLSLNNLPDTIGNLSQLQQLQLSDCMDLKNLPDAIGNLSRLQHLDLSKCFRLKNLPHTIGNLLQLQHLDLSKCMDLKNLPATIGKLSQLQHLDLSDCFSLKNLPATIGDLSQLQHLNLFGCLDLTSLPDTIGNLSQLQQLDLNGFLEFNLPHTIGNLS